MPNFDFLHWLCIWALTQCCATALPVIINHRFYKRRSINRCSFNITNHHHHRVYDEGRWVAPAPCPTACFQSSKLRYQTAQWSTGTVHWEMPTSVLDKSDGKLVKQMRKNKTLLLPPSPTRPLILWRRYLCQDIPITAVIRDASQMPNTVSYKCYFSHFTLCSHDNYDLVTLWHYDLRLRIYDHDNRIYNNDSGSLLKVRFSLEPYQWAAPAGSGTAQPWAQPWRYN